MTASTNLAGLEDRSAVKTNALSDRKIHMGADGLGGEQGSRVEKISGIEQVFYLAQVDKGRAQFLLEVDRA